MADKDLQPQGLQISEEDLSRTPPAVLQLLFKLFEHAAQQEQRIKELVAETAN